jgi:hypothetical protein
MFRAAPTSSLGGHIVLLQHLVLSLSVNGCIVRQLRADCYRIKELCIKLVIETSLYYDARSEKYQIIMQIYNNLQVFRYYT